MKKGNQVILALGSILAVTLGVGVTATYAWFRVSRSAQVNITNTSLTGEGSSLEISYHRLSDSGSLPATSTPSAKGFDITAVTNTITDVSGDGVSFYKPTWALDASAAEERADSINQVTNTSTKTYYIRFGVTFKNSGQTAFDIYFQDQTAVTPVTIATPDNETAEAKAAREAQQAKNNQAALTTRVAVWDDGHQNLLSTWQPVETTSNSTYLDYTYLAKNSADTKGVYGVAGYSLLNPAKETFHVGSFSHLSAVPATAIAGQRLLHVDAGGSTNAEFALWAEGTFYATNNDAQGGEINASLNFIAL